jgi:two-component system phosphate regulon sensor histidine kinase PhoR
LGGNTIARALLDDARDGLLALDDNGTIIEANEAAADRLGRTRAHLIGKPLAACVPLEERRAFRVALLHITPEEPVTLELSLGEPPLQTIVALRVVPRVAPRAIAVTLLADPAREALPLRQRAPADVRLDRLFQRFPQAVVGIRRDRRVAFANHPARKLLGTEAVRIGRPIADHGLGLELKAIAERLTTIPAPLGPIEVELANRRMLRIAGLGVEGEEPAILFIEDVTSQHRRERPMREFVRNAAHQLRTPLTGIATAVEVLQSGAKDDPDSRDRFLAHIAQHTERLTRLTRGLLVLARAQSGDTLRLEFVQLRPLLESIAASAEPAPGVHVETACPASLAALGEPDLVHEALAALVDNAVRHTREGRVRLSASDADGNVVVEVADTGIGVLPEHRDRVFEPFYRVVQDGKGFGLGLAIAAQAVEAMNGELLVVDNAKAGTTFAIKLPSARIVR